MSESVMVKISSEFAIILNTPSSLFIILTSENHLLDPPSPWITLILCSTIFHCVANSLLTLNLPLLMCYILKEDMVLVLWSVEFDCVLPFHLNDKLRQQSCLEKCCWRLCENTIATKLECGSVTRYNISCSNWLEHYPRPGKIQMFVYLRDYNTWLSLSYI